MTLLSLMRRHLQGKRVKALAILTQVGSDQGFELFCGGHKFEMDDSRYFMSGRELFGFSLPEPALVVLSPVLCLIKSDFSMTI